MIPRHTADWKGKETLVYHDTFCVLSHKEVCVCVCVCVCVRALTDTQLSSFCKIQNQKKKMCLYKLKEGFAGDEEWQRKGFAQFTYLNGFQVFNKQLMYYLEN